MSTTPGATRGPTGPVPSADVLTFMRYATRLDEAARFQVLGSLHRQIFSHGAPLNEATAIEIFERRYLLAGTQSERFPRRLYKMTTAKYADALCAEGQFGLGPLVFYNTVEQTSIVDSQEGVFLSYAYDESQAVVAVAGIGRHTLIYCTTRNPDAVFAGYDACVEIVRPAEFFQTMAKAVASKFQGVNSLKSSLYGSCHYQHTRIVEGPLHGLTAARLRAGELSFNTIDSISNEKFLIKGAGFSADDEYRFAFEMITDVPGYSVFTEPALAQFCRRVR